MLWWPLAPFGSLRVHHFRSFDSLPEKANPPINLAQPPLAVLIVGVFTAIAVAGSPRHYRRHGTAFPGKQEPEFIVEALEAARRDVVFALRRLVRFWSSRKAVSHPGVLFHDAMGIEAAKQPQD